MTEKIDDNELPFQGGDEQEAERFCFGNEGEKRGEESWW